MNLKKIGIIFLVMLLAATVFAATPEVTQVNYNPSPGVPGTTMTILVQIENKDAVTQKGLTITLEDSYPFTIKSSTDQPNPKLIGDLAAFGKTQAQFTVYVDPTAENKTYDFPITISQQFDSTSKKSFFPIVISGKEPVVKVIATSSDKLLPGQEKEITFELQNVGTSPAYDVVLEMQEDRTIVATGAVVERDITPLGAAAAYLQMLSPGEKKITSLKVSVTNTATIKNYTLPIKVSYRNAAGTRTTDTSYIGLKVYSNAQLDATLKESAGVILAGQKTDVTIELFNKGLGKAEFTLVELSTADGTIEKARQFIGALGPNDVDTVKTAMTFNKAGDQIVKVTIAYQDADAVDKTTTIEVPIKVQAVSAEAPNILLIVIVLAVLAFLGWNFFLKGKKK
ncbi:MAG: hypothetical protein WC746_03410 [archaeon]